MITFIRSEKYLPAFFLPVGFIWMREMKMRDFKPITKAATLSIHGTFEMDSLAIYQLPLGMVQPDEHLFQWMGAMCLALGKEAVGEQAAFYSFSGFPANWEEGATFEYCFDLRQ